MRACRNRAAGGGCPLTRCPASRESLRARSRAPGPVAPALPSPCLSCVWVTFLAQNSILLNSGDLKFRDSKQIDKHLSYNIRNQPKCNLFAKMKRGGSARPSTENQDKTEVNTLQSVSPYYLPDPHECASCTTTSSGTLKHGDGRTP